MEYSTIYSGGVMAKHTHKINVTLEVVTYDNKDVVACDRSRHDIVPLIEDLFTQNLQYITRKRREKILGIRVPEFFFIFDGKGE